MAEKERAENVAPEISKDAMLEIQDDSMYPEYEKGERTVGINPLGYTPRG